MRLNGSTLAKYNSLDELPADLLAQGMGDEQPPTPMFVEMKKDTAVVHVVQRGKKNEYQDSK